MYHSGQTEEEWPESCGYVLVCEFMIDRKIAYGSHKETFSPLI
jgi:hypothetical protein